MKPFSGGEPGFLGWVTASVHSIYGRSVFLTSSDHQEIDPSFGYLSETCFECAEMIILPLIFFSCTGATSKLLVVFTIAIPFKKKTSISYLSRAHHRTPLDRNQLRTHLSRLARYRDFKGHRNPLEFTRTKVFTCWPDGFVCWTYGLKVSEALKGRAGVFLQNMLQLQQL